MPLRFLTLSLSTFFVRYDTLLGLDLASQCGSRLGNATRLLPIAWQRGSKAVQIPRYSTSNNVDWKQPTPGLG